MLIPEKFRLDIQDKDTAIVPAVFIHTFNDTDSPDIYISTNSLNLPFQTSADTVDYNNVAHFQPILLNVPSLKESIDIEKRNYKISSVNIDISNLPYDGERFSDRVANISLINTEVRIHWVSPSVTHISEADIYAPMNDSSFLVYVGVIRRYEHDDEKVRLVVEDRSQAKLHKDLPHNTLEGNEVPDKYKG